MATVRRCSVAEIYDNAASAELMAKYSSECANPLMGAIAARRESYEEFERLGVGRFYGVFEQSSLVGFACVLIAVVPHFGQLYATTESLFVERSARRRGAGRLLMDTVEQDSRERGCIGLFYTAPVRSRFARLLAMLPWRYTHTNDVYFTRLV